MMNTISETILVKSKKAFTIYRLSGEALAEVLEGKLYVGVLNRETDEYFAKDGQGREFLVGELDKLDELKLEPEFELFPA
ncbi:MAG TPA: hypothetical protein H9745_03440 [Candidatus Agathobaculum stercoravium]|nr:hypothetical protein [Candidatus Agathobaculum stercoravium]